MGDPREVEALVPYVISRAKSKKVVNIVTEKFVVEEFIDVAVVAIFSISPHLII